MKTKHGDEVVDESLEVDLLAFEGVDPGDVVVREEVDTQRFLEEWKHALVAIDVKW